MTLTLAPKTEARLQALATQRNESPEAVVDAALEMLARNEPMHDGAAQEADEETAYQEEQARLRRLLLAATEEAKLVEPMPYDSPARTYYRESEVGKIITEKFRKQGFNM